MWRAACRLLFLAHVTLSTMPRCHPGALDERKSGFCASRGVDHERQSISRCSPRSATRHRLSDDPTLADRKRGRKVKIKADGDERRDERDSKRVVVYPLRHHCLESLLVACDAIQQTKAINLLITSYTPLRACVAPYSSQSFAR